MLVVADEQTFRVGGEGGLSGSGEAEEDCGVLAFEVGVGRAVHRGDAAQRVEVVHHGEESLLHFAAVPGVDDYLFALLDVEGHHGLGVEAELLIILAFCFRGVEDHEVGGEVFEFLLGGADEHVLHEVCLPGHLHDEAYAKTCGGVGAAVAVHHVEHLVAELAHGFLAQAVPHFGGYGFVVVLVAVRGPPYGVFGDVVLDEIFILGGAAGVDACHYVHGAEVGDDAFLVACEGRVCLILKQLLVRGIVDNLFYFFDAIFGQI